MAREDIQVCRWSIPTFWLETNCIRDGSLTGGLKRAMVRSFPELKIRSDVAGKDPTIICGRPKTWQVASHAFAPMLNSTIYVVSGNGIRPL